MPSSQPQGTTALHHARFRDIPTDFNWNADLDDLSPLPAYTPAEPTAQQASQTELFSECLRDGLHGVVAYPPVEKILPYVEALSAFGITSAMVAIYQGEKNQVDESTRTLLTYMRDQMPTLIPTVLCLCTPESFRWAIACREIHPKLEFCLFMGSAPSRRLVQGWDLDFILERLAHYISEAVKLGIPVMGATEHTTQTPPADLAQLVRTQVDHGAYRFAIADTIGIARPRGAYRIVRFVRSTLDEMGAYDVQIDWHGHRDTGNALANALTAVAAGARRLHVVARGVGERSGNTQLEDVALNLFAILNEAKMSSPWRLTQLTPLLALYEHLAGMATPEHGMLAKRYNHTSLGIHTDAILKATKLADEAAQQQDFSAEQKLREMARTIYSAIDPQTVGEASSFGISQWSGRSSVQLAYRSRGYTSEEGLREAVNHLLPLAKALRRELTEDELDHFFATAEMSLGR